jgi:hypothetical protein
MESQYNCASLARGFHFGKSDAGIPVHGDECEASRIRSIFDEMVKDQEGFVKRLEAEVALLG